MQEGRSSTGEQTESRVSKVETQKVPRLTRFELPRQGGPLSANELSIYPGSWLLAGDSRDGTIGTWQGRS